MTSFLDMFESFGPALTLTLREPTGMTWNRIGGGGRRAAGATAGGGLKKEGGS